jgi:hypothetical protein
MAIPIEALLEELQRCWREVMHSTRSSYSPGAKTQKKPLRFASAFICGASVLAIAPALPLEYTRCFPIALFSTVECISKAACVASLAVAAMTSDGVGERLSVPNRTADEET